MIQQIIDNFEKECEKNPDDMTVRVICDHVVDNLQGASEESLKNIINKPLTIKGAIDAMRDVTRKRKTGDYAVLNEAEGFKIVDEYFGIDGHVAQIEKTEKPQKTVSLFDMI